MTPIAAIQLARIELAALEMLAALCECAERLPNEHDLQPIIRAAIRKAVFLKGGAR